MNIPNPTPAARPFRFDLPLTATLALAIPALACGDGGARNDVDATETEESGGSGESTGTETGPGESLARDIELSLVELNQGTAIPLIVDGVWIAEDARNGQVISDRKALLRAYWETDPGFEAREVEARLHIEYSDGEILDRAQVLTIDKPAYAGSLDRSFLFDLVEEQLRPGMQFSLSLWEVDPAYAELPPPAADPIVPSDGSLAQLGVQPEPVAIEVVVIPVEVQWPNCNTTVPAEDLVPLFADMLYMKNPTQRTTLRIHETPLISTEELDNLWEMFPAIQAYRVEDNAPSNVYYYALMDTCNGGIAGAGGMAFSIPPATQGAGFERVAVGLWFGDDQWSADTFVHEIGHSQGLFHVRCPGADALGPDPTYPYADGGIGSWGFGLLDFGLRNPTSAHDYMSYCYDGNWTSDWTWNKNFRRIRTLTSWEGGGALPSEMGELLIGVLPDDDGSQPLWWTTRGELPVGSSTDSLTSVVARTGAGSIQLPATRQRLADGAAAVISVALPLGSMAATRIELDGVDLEIPAALLTR